MQLPALEGNMVESNLVHVLFMKLYMRDMRILSPFVGVIGSYPLSKRQERSMWMMLCRKHSSKHTCLSAFKVKDTKYLLII